LIERIVILNTAAYRSSRIPLRIALCRIPLLGPFVIRAFNGFAWPATFMAVTRRLPALVKRGFLLPYRTWRSRTAVNAFVQDIPLRSSHPSYATLREIEENLKRFSDRRILICWGGRDFCFNQHFLARWREIYPTAEVLRIAEAGHYLLEDAPEETISTIAQFLRE
jgi:cis-3-alkyl-4-acyloxetan-2-one decarboxylase